MLFSSTNIIINYFFYTLLININCLHNKIQEEHNNNAQQKITRAYADRDHLDRAPSRPIFKQDSAAQCPREVTVQMISKRRRALSA